MLSSIENEMQQMQVVFDNSMNADIDRTLFRGELREQEPMWRHTSWKTGGNAEYFYSAADKNDLSVFISSLPADMLVTWIGLGSNLLVRDSGLPGVVISVVGAINDLEQSGKNLITIGAGVTSTKAARYAAKHDLSGIEFLAAIPGSIGGALAMNAGAYGGEIWSYVKQVETINRAGKLQTYSSDQFDIAYRSVSLADDEWFVSCTLELQVSNKEQVEKTIKDMLSERAEAQPLGQHSCGSVFRNPENDYAARLIDFCELKGKKVGGAIVSDKHANFIINTGNATSSDIERLIELVQATVYEKCEVKLIPEVRIIGQRGTEQ